MTAKSLQVTFNQFFQSEKSGGYLLIACTAISIALANSSLGSAYVGFWQREAGGLSIEHWINDGLMAIFFLLIGLELERELYTGELSKLKNALLPFFAALGGMLAPALLHFSFNMGTPTQSGFGIPMATDIAFTLGVLALLGNRVPTALKVFVVAFAVIDDLGAIVLIAVFYTVQLSPGFLLAAFAVWGVLLALNLIFRIHALLPYIVGGAAMWFLMLKSGVHATIAGVLLAFAIPFARAKPERPSASNRLEGLLHKPVAFIILPIFALANTCIVVNADWMQQLSSVNSLGIIAGLILGKPLGVLCFCGLAIAIGLCQLPPQVQWPHMVCAGLLGGIGFTMSIFIANLAFSGNADLINESKMAILAASSTAAVLGFIWLIAWDTLVQLKRKS